MSEARATFRLPGVECAVLVSGDGPLGPADAAVAAAGERLAAWHARFTRFDPASELARLNADPRPAVQVSPEMARFAAAVRRGGELTGGLVDATLLGRLEAAGYGGDLATSVPLDAALRAAPPRRPAAPDPAARWREVRVEGRQVIRPPGLRLDSGGLAKGLFADMLADELAAYPAFAVDCAGDLRMGGTAGRARAVQVLGPFADAVLETFAVAAGGVATSGIGRRSWLAADGAPAHHLLDPSTGRPAFTGVVQATALAPTALEAEIRAKAALLAGPHAAARWLPHGGLVVPEPSRKAPGKLTAARQRAGRA